jgi:hypothetical protein
VYRLVATIGAAAGLGGRAGLGWSWGEGSFRPGRSSCRGITMRRLIVGAALTATVALGACTSGNAKAPPEQATATTTATTVPDVKTMETRAQEMVRKAGFPKTSVMPTGLNGPMDPNPVGAAAHGEILNQAKDDYIEYLDLYLFPSNELRDAALANDTSAITQSGGAFQGPSAVLVGERFYGVVASVQEGGGWPLAPEQVAHRLGARLR